MIYVAQSVDTSADADLIFYEIPCYVTWWTSYYGYQRNLASTLLILLGYTNTDNSSYTLNEGQIETVKNFIEWCSSVCGVTVKLTRHDSILGVVYSTKKIIENVYSLSIDYDPLVDSADKIFYILNHIRFLTPEFLKEGIPEYKEYKDVLYSIFLNPIVHTGHVPIKLESYETLFGNPFEKDISSYPRYGPLLGHALYEFFTSLKNHTWGNSIANCDKYARLSSGIPCSSWIAFYKDWYKNYKKEELGHK